HDGSIQDLTFSFDGRFILSSSNDTTARLWEVESGQEVGRFIPPTRPSTNGVLGVAFAPDGRTALLGCRDGVVRVWTLPEFTTTKSSTTVRLSVDLPELAHLAVSPDGQLALLAGADKTARLWDLVARKEVRRF